MSYSSLVSESRYTTDAAHEEAVAIQASAQALAGASVRLQDDSTKPNKDAYNMASYIIDNSEEVLGVEKSLYVKQQNLLVEIKSIIGADLALKFTSSIDLAVIQKLSEIKAYFFQIFDENQIEKVEDIAQEIFHTINDGSNEFRGLLRDYSNENLKDKLILYLRNCVVVALQASQATIQADQESHFATQVNTSTIPSTPAESSTDRFEDFNDAMIEDSFKLLIEELRKNSPSENFLEYALISLKLTYFQQLSDQFKINVLGGYPNEEIPSVDFPISRDGKLSSTGAEQVQRVSSVQTYGEYYLWIEKIIKSESYLLRWRRIVPPKSRLFEEERSPHDFFEGEEE